MGYPRNVDRITDFNLKVTVTVRNLSGMSIDVETTTRSRVDFNTESCAQE